MAVQAGIRDDRRRTRPWLALAVGLAVAAASAFGWRALIEERRHEQRAVASLTAEAVAGEIEERLAAQRAAAGQLAALRAVAPPRDDLEVEARLIMAQQPGLEGVTWTGPAGELKVGEPAPHAWRRPSLAMDESPALLGPIAGADGAQRYALIAATADGGHVVAHYRADRSLVGTAVGRAAGWVTSVYANGTLLYRRGEPAPHDLAWPAVERPLELAAQTPWLLRVEPGRELEAVSSPEFAHYVLGAGLVIATLLGGLVYIGQLAVRRARALEESNLLLARDLDARIGAEKGLRELNEELEERVTERTADLERAVEELESLNYTVSHDLKSPLGAILNFASILEEDYADVLDAPGREYLGRIGSSAHSALGMMEGLLAFARVAREPLEPEPVNVSGLVRELFEEACARHAGRRPELELGDLPAAHGDARLLRQLFENLLSNAIKFSSKREAPRVGVEGETTNGEVHYVVRDNGVGFDMRHAGKLFGVFERLHSQDEFVGGGLGLAMVARIVDRHEGRVWAEALPDAGASFHVVLPRAGEETRQ